MRRVVNTGTLSEILDRKVIIMKNYKTEDIIAIIKNGIAEDMDISFFRLIMMFFLSVPLI